MSKEMVEMISDWQELIGNAQNEYVFDEPFDNELFKKCMKEVFEYFFIKNELKNTYSVFEVEMYGLVESYSNIPAVTQGYNSTLFEASAHAAGILAHAILHPEVYQIDGYKITYEFYMYLTDGSFKPVTYDFETGDLKEYIELVEMNYWD